MKKSERAFCFVESICIDNNIFRLHYKVTVIALVTFSLLVNSRYANFTNPATPYSETVGVT